MWSKVTGNATTPSSLADRRSEHSVFPSRGMLPTSRNCNTGKKPTNNLDIKPMKPDMGPNLRSLRCNRRCWGSLALITLETRDVSRSGLISRPQCGYLALSI